MDVQRPPFGSPVLCIDNFLLEHEAQQVLQECDLPVCQSVKGSHVRSLLVGLVGDLGVRFTW